MVFDGTNRKSALAVTLNGLNADGEMVAVKATTYNQTPPSYSDGDPTGLETDDHGNIQVNLGVQTGGVSAAAGSVTGTSALLMEANANRRELCIQNHDASASVYIRYDGYTTATADGACYKIPPGGEFRRSAPGYVPPYAIYARSSTGTVVVHTSEA